MKSDWYNIILIILQHNAQTPTLVQERVAAAMLLVAMVTDQGSCFIVTVFLDEEDDRFSRIGGITHRLIALDTSLFSVKWISSSFCFLELFWICFNHSVRSGILSYTCCVQNKVEIKCSILYLLNSILYLLIWFNYIRLHSRTRCRVLPNKCLKCRYFTYSKRVIWKGIEK